MGGWTEADVARLNAKRSQKPLPSRRQKFHAEPCIVTPDGTLFTTADVEAVEFVHNQPRTGTLKERAARCRIVGQWFASLKEGRRYLELRALEHAGALYNLRCQVAFRLTVVSTVDGSHHDVGVWTADFAYVRDDGELVVEDTKSTVTRTEAYQLRKKIVQALYGFQILET